MLEGFVSWFRGLKSSYRWAIGIFAVIVIWIFHPPTGEPGQLAVLNTLVGALGAAFGMVVSYFFGSSSGSQQKDETISSLAAAPLPGGAGAVTVTTATPGHPGTTVVSKDVAPPANGSPAAATAVKPT